MPVPDKGECSDAGLLVAIGIVLAIGMARAEIIDRILAVVDGAIIMQSDVTAAIRLGLVRGPSDPVVRVVDRLIERRLMLREVDRYAPPDPARGGCGPERRRDPGPRRLAGAVRRDSPADRDRSRSAAARTSATTCASSPTCSSGSATSSRRKRRSSRYYRDHAAEFSQGGVLRPFEEAHGVVKAALVAERRAATIRDWLADLRRRANVNVLLR